MHGSTETEFFERAGMEDTKIGQSREDDPAVVAKVDWDAMMKVGDVAGGKNEARPAVASVTPAAALAEQHRKQAEPGSGR